MDLEREVMSGKRVLRGAPFTPTFPQTYPANHKTNTPLPPLIVIS